MGATQQTETASPPDKPPPQELLYSSVDHAKGHGTLHFKNYVTSEQAKAVAFDFASMAAGQTSLDQMVVDMSNGEGITLQIFSGLENRTHSYTITAEESSEELGARGKLNIKAEPDAGNAEVIEKYLPEITLPRILKKAKPYETWGGFVEGKPPIREQLYHKGVALAQFAGIWTAFYAMNKAFPEQDAPLWLGVIWGVAWCYVLIDSIYRIGDNVSVFHSKKIAEKEKRLEKRKKSLAHAISHNGASED